MQFMMKMNIEPGVSLLSTRSLFERLTNSQGFAPPRFSQLVSSTENFMNNSPLQQLVDRNMRWFSMGNCRV